MMEIADIQRLQSEAVGTETEVPVKPSEAPPVEHPDTVPERKFEPSKDPIAPPLQPDEGDLEVCVLPRWTLEIGL